MAYFHEITMKHPEVRLFEPDVFYSHRYDHPTHYKPPMPAGAYAVHHWSSKWYRDSFKQLIEAKNSNMNIPKKFHQIWLDPEPMPPRFLEWQKTWTALNPGWDWHLGPR